jgi:hypothetical protein
VAGFNRISNYLGGPSPNDWRPEDDDPEFREGVAELLPSIKRLVRMLQAAEITGDEMATIVTRVMVKMISYGGEHGR